MINDEDHKKLTDTVKDLSLNEASVAAFRNSGVSMESFKIRQGIVDALHSKYPSYDFTKFDSDDQQLPDMFDELMRIHHEERLKKMSQQAVERFHNAMASLPNSKVLPVTMEIDGVTTKVGDALIDSTEVGFCIMHVVIDGQENVAALLRTNLNQISIGNKDDFKKES